MELWEGFPFTKEKLNHKVLRLGSKLYKLRNHEKDNSDKKIKSVFNIYVGDEFYMWFWFFIRNNIWILGKMKSKCFWEFLIFFCLCGWLWMGVKWEYKWRYIIIWRFKKFYAVKILFFDRYWQKAEQIASHNFWSWMRVPHSRFVEDVCLVNCDA